MCVYDPHCIKSLTAAPLPEYSSVFVLLRVSPLISFTAFTAFSSFFGCRVLITCTDKGWLSLWPDEEQEKVNSYS